jgi:hypothetical protein
MNLIEDEGSLRIVGEHSLIALQAERRLEHLVWTKDLHRASMQQIEVVPPNRLWSAPWAAAFEQMLSWLQGQYR